MVDVTQFEPHAQRLLVDAMKQAQLTFHSEIRLEHFVRAACLDAVMRELLEDAGGDVDELAANATRCLGAVPTAQGPNYLSRDFLQLMDAAAAKRADLSPGGPIQRGHLFQALLASPRWSLKGGFTPRAEQDAPGWFSRLFERDPLDVAAFEHPVRVLLVSSSNIARGERHAVITLAHFVLAALDEPLLAALISADGGRREVLHPDAARRLAGISASGAAPYLSSAVVSLMNEAIKTRDQMAPGALVQLPHIYLALRATQEWSPTQGFSNSPAPRLLAFLSRPFKN